jgi:hypothetical protein
MAGANKKTTMAKLNRERKLRERRMEKQARKDARKQGSAGRRGHSGDMLTAEAGDMLTAEADQTVASVTEYDAPLAVRSPGDEQSAKVRAEAGSGEQQSTLPAGGSATGGEPEAAPNEPGT